jgi:hypothetical protein
VEIINGLFTVEVNSADEFGLEPFNGEDRFLRISVAAPPGSSFIPLDPPQPLTAIPYSRFSARSHWTGLCGLPSGFADGVDDIGKPHALDASDGSPADALFVGSAGDVGIGTTSPARKLHVSNGSSGGASPTATDLLVEDDGTCYINLTSPDASERGIVFGSPADSDHGGVYYTNAGGLSLRTSGNTTRMIINDLGNVTIGRTNSNDARMHVASNAPTRVLKIDLLGGDGQLVAWARDDSVVGDVSVSGNTVSYNAFTGSHYAWLPQPLERGTLVTLTGENRKPSQGGEVIYGVVPTSRPNDPACLGAYLAPHVTEESPATTDEHQIMSVGNGELWVIDAGSDIIPGDLLISSHVPGCAMRDDPVRFPVGHIVARAAEAVRWSDVKHDSEGLRRARISVLFDRFTRSMDPASLSALHRELADLRARLERLEQHRLANELITGAAYSGVNCTTMR